jgi:hypothetical protein
MKKGLLTVGVVALVSAAALLLADTLGLLPSLPRTLAHCKAEADKSLVGLHRYDDKPMDDPRNAEWFAKHSELVTSCMESHGYVLKKHEVASFEERMHAVARSYNNDSLSLSASFRNDAVQIEEFWQRRWFWQ